MVTLAVVEFRNIQATTPPLYFVQVPHNDPRFILRPIPRLRLHLYNYNPSKSRTTSAPSFAVERVRYYSIVWYSSMVWYGYKVGIVRYSLV